MPKKKNNVVSIKGSHFQLRGPGPFLMPDLSRFESLQVNETGPLVVARLYTTDHQRLLLPISYHAVSSLVNAQEQVLPRAKILAATRLDPAGMADPVEMPLLAEFVGFHVVDSDWYVLEFLNENSQRILVSISSNAFRHLRSTLALALRKRQ
jgi:hypothetical protein